MPSLQNEIIDLDGEGCIERILPSSERGSKERFLLLIQALCDEFDFLQSRFPIEDARAAASSTPQVPKLPGASATPQVPKLAGELSLALSSLTSTGKKPVNLSKTAGDKQPRQADQGTPMAVIGLDLNNDGITDLRVAGLDRDHDGIPDCLQQASSGQVSDGLKKQNSTLSTEDMEKIEKTGLPAHYLEELHEQFDRLDAHDEGIVSVDLCVSVLNEFSDKAVQPDDVVTILKTAHEAGHLERKDGTFDGTYLNFDDYVHLMTSQDTSSKTLAIEEEDGVGAALKRALKAFDARQVALAEKLEQQRQKHKKLAFVLDVVPAPVIIINALVMGLRADIVPKSPLWNWLDMCFLFFYTVEAITKWYMFGTHVYWCGPEKLWNWFDISCIGVSVTDAFLTYIWPIITGGASGADVGGLMLIKMLRLLKLARLVRVLRYKFFNELKSMIIGVVSGLRVLFWAIVLLFVIVFFLGVVLNQVLGSQEGEFETVPISMFTVFRCVTDGCSSRTGTPLQEHLRQEHGFTFMFGYVITFMLVTFGLFNLIMAIFIENVTSTSDRRKQEELGANREKSKIKLEAMFAKLIIHKDLPDGKRHHLLLPRQRRELQAQFDALELAYRSLPKDLAISRPIFAQWFNDEEFVEMLQEADIETTNETDLFDALDEDMSGELTLSEVIDGLIRLRGPITKRDMIATRIKVRKCNQMLHDLCVASHVPT